MKSLSTDAWLRTHVIRFAELRPLAASPADVLLPRYRRQRYSVIGRANERAPDAPGVAVDAKINFGYIRCESGTGNCSHKHPNWEIFIPMSGVWEMTLEGGVLEGRHQLTLGAWDVIAVPGETYHSAVNVSGKEACLLSLNPGNKGASYTVHPSVVEELRRVSQQAADAARNGVDVRIDP